MHNSAITYGPASPAIARSSWFLLVRLPARLHFSFPTVAFAVHVQGCRKEFPPCIHVHEVPPCIHVHEVPPCLHVHVHGHVSSLYSTRTGRSSHDVSKGLERTSLQQFFSPCTFTPPTRQRLRGRSRCKRSTSAVLNYFAYGIVAATAFKGSFQVQKASINGTLQYGVRKGASSFDFVDFCSSPSRQGYRKGAPRSCPCRQVHVMQFSTLSRTG